MDNKGSGFWLIVLCFAIIYIVWGSTYVAIAFALESLPPFLLASIRFMVAGLLILGYCWFQTGIKINRVQLKNASMGGFLFFALGNGAVVWGIQHVESGLAALIIALQPLNVAILLWMMKGERPNLLTWAGLLIGILGMALLIGQPHYMSNINWLLGLLAILVGMSAWAYMSVRIPDIEMPKPLVLSSGIQMLAGGIILVGFSAANQEFANMELIISLKSLLALGFLILFGSIIAFTAFNYLLIKVSPTRVATAAYVNPIVALFLGWWLNNENLSLQSVLASALLIGGVLMINLAKKSRN